MNAETGTNLVLIGMPSAGKSTVGVLAAKALGMDFLDTDILLQTLQGAQLQTLIDRYGLTRFLQMEAEAVRTLDPTRTVIATGGSVVYAQDAMLHLKRIGRIVYLEVPLAELERRLGDASSRGIARREGQTLKELYAERIPLYERYADITVPFREGMGLADVVAQLRESTCDLARERVLYPPDAMIQ